MAGVSSSLACIILNVSLNTYHASGPITYLELLSPTIIIILPLLGILTASESSHIRQFPLLLESDTSIDHRLPENSTCIRDAENRG